MRSDIRYVPVAIDITPCFAHGWLEVALVCEKESGASMCFLSRRLVCPREMHTEDTANEYSYPCDTPSLIRTITSLSKEVCGNYTTFPLEHTRRRYAIRKKREECDSDFNLSSAQ